MYLNQLINYHGIARCNGAAPEHKVIDSLARSQGISYEAAAREVERAVMMKDVRRVRCDCQ
jgi:hypothetical protein